MDLENTGWNLKEGNRNLDELGSYVILENVSNPNKKLIITVESDENYYNYADGSKIEYVLHYENKNKNIFDVFFVTYDKNLAIDVINDVVNNGIKKFEENLNDNL